VIFSESTCSGVSKISFFCVALLGKQVPQNDVLYKIMFKVVVFPLWTQMSIIVTYYTYNKLLLEAKIMTVVDSLTLSLRSFTSINESIFCSVCMHPF
jgi:hypothetical protein